MARDLTALPLDKLMKDFMNACGRAGLSNSGLVIDPAADIDRRVAHEYKDELLRRLAVDEDFEALKKKLLFYFIAEANWKLQKIYDEELRAMIGDQETLSQLKEWCHED